MKKRWWLLCLAAILVTCGLIRDLSQTLTFGLYGVGLMLMGIIGDTLVPHANRVAYYNRTTGRRVNADGTPYYTGVKNFIKGALSVLVLGFIGGMCVYGISTIIHWITPDFDPILLFCPVGLVILVFTVIDTFNFYSHK